MTYTSNQCTLPSPSRLIAVALGVLLLTGCARSSDTQSHTDTATRMRLAQLAGAEGDANGELALLAPAAAQDHSNAALQTRYATALAKAGQNKEALDVALALYNRDKSDVGVALLIGRLYVRLNDGQSAAPIYQAVIARDASNLEAFNGLGIAEIMQRAFPQAEANFRRAVAIAPADAASRSNLALALTLERKTDDAIQILEAVWREDNTSRRVRTNLALAYAAAGSRDKAVALLTPIMTPAEVEKSVNAYAQVSGSDGTHKESGQALASKDTAQVLASPDSTSEAVPPEPDVKASRKAKRKTIPLT
jgi:Flp pilus assembly protein TadD